MIDWETQSLRSFLFVPGSDEHKLSRAATFGSDAIVIDLEDAVADQRKQAARATTRAAIPTFGKDTPVAVRVNTTTTSQLEDDIAAVITPGLNAIVVPKVEDVEGLERADRTVTRIEQAAGIEPGTVRLLAVIETPTGIARCETIMSDAPDRVHTCIFGSGDFSTALGVDLTPDAQEILYARSRLVVAARAAARAAPIDGPWLWLEDAKGLETDSVRSRQLGFQGRAILHPCQVAPVQRSYSALTEEAVARARRIVAAFEDAERRGVAALRVDEQFVDYPIYRSARERILQYGAMRNDREVDR